MNKLMSSYTLRLLIILFTVVVIALFATERSVRSITTKEIVKEKETFLFGLTNQLDNALSGTFEDILISKNATELPCNEQIQILNNELKEITDFVALGVPGVGVGYYSRELDAIITYGPEREF